MSIGSTSLGSGSSGNINIEMMDGVQDRVRLNPALTGGSLRLATVMRCSLHSVIRAQLVDLEYEIIRLAHPTTS